MQGNPGETQSFVDPRHVLLIPGNPVKRFGADNIELSGPAILHQALKSVTSLQAGSRNRLIMIQPHDLPTLPLCQFPTEPQLIVDGTGFCRSEE